MEYIQHLGLAIMAMVVTMAMTTNTATGTGAPPPPPPLPFTAPPGSPLPEIPPCLDDLMPCVSVYENSSMLAPCCDALERVWKRDPACICGVLNEARSYTSQLGINATDSDQMFSRCNISGASASSCDHQGPAGSQVGNVSPHSTLFKAFPILVLLQLFFMFRV